MGGAVVTSALLLDTHVWLWCAEENAQITPALRDRIDVASEASQLFLSAISIWELAMLSAYGRVKLALPCLKWVEDSLQAMNLQLLALDPKIAVESAYLSDFHGDPADRMIVATARAHDLPLLTKDQKILDYAQGSNLKLVRL